MGLAKFQSRKTRVGAAIMAVRIPTTVANQCVRASLGDPAAALITIHFARRSASH